MKKILSVLLLLFLMTGCSAEYTLIIDEKNIFESINIIAENEEESYGINYYSKPIPAFINSQISSETLQEQPGIEYYNISKSINSNLFNMNLNYNFNFNNFKNSQIINKSVSVLQIEEKQGIYKFNTGATLKIFESYPSLNNVRIKIVLDDNYEIVETNANSINDNEYFWNYSRDNYNKSPITFIIKNKDISNSGNNNNNNTNNNINNNQTNENSITDIVLVALSLASFVLALILIITFSKKIRK